MLTINLSTLLKAGKWLCVLKLRLNYPRLSSPHLLLAAFKGAEVDQRRGSSGRSSATGNLSRKGSHKLNPSNLWPFLVVGLVTEQQKNKELNPLLTKEPEDEIKDEATKKEDPDDEESHMKAGGPDKKTIDFMSIQCQLDRSSKIKGYTLTPA